MPIVRKMADSEAPAVRNLLQQAGGTPRTPESWAQDRMTALVLAQEAADGGSIEAAMPMARRVIQPRGGSNSEQSAADSSRAEGLTVGWLSNNQFASRMAWRRQTRTTAADWARLLPDIDALLVMRREESSLLGGSAAARWYAQTGFSDVLAVRCLYLEMDGPPALLGGTGAPGADMSGRYHVQVISPTVPGAPPSGDAPWDARLWQHEMLAVYRDVFHACGGAPVRTPEFWANTLASHYYREHYQFQIIGLWSPPPPAIPSTGRAVGACAQARLMGYAVVGWSGWHSRRPRMDILELATRQWDTAVAGDLIRTTCQLAWSKQVRQVRAVISVHDPYRGHLTRSGFQDRWGYVMMARWLHAQRYLDRLAANLPPEVGDFRVQLAVPGDVPLVLGHGARGGTAPSLMLQGDRRTITRLLLNRTDLPAALREGTLVASASLSDDELARLSLCFPWTPWIFHMLDFI